MVFLLQGVDQMSVRRAATIKDVAAAAGVGVATVSRVLSGTGAVSPATRERVLAAARELDYRPSALGRGLKLRRTGSIGLIVPALTDPFYAGLASGVLECARTLGEHVILDVTHEDPAREAEIVDRMLEQRVDGLVAVPAGGDPAIWKSVVSAGPALVFAERVVAGVSGVPAVLADDRTGLASLVEYLAGLGHRKMALLGGAVSPTAGGAAQTMLETAFREVLGALGVPVEDDLITRSRASRDSAYATAAGLFQRRPDLTAVVATSHLLGEAAVLVAREFDLRVPADVSIAMLGDVPWAELCDPPLTAVARPARDMGYRACEVLLRDRSRHRNDRPVMLSTQLIVRASCGPRTGIPGVSARAARAR